MALHAVLSAPTFRICEEVSRSRTYQVFRWGTSPFPQASVRTLSRARGPGCMMGSVRSRAAITLACSEHGLNGAVIWDRAGSGEGHL